MQKLYELFHQIYNVQWIVQTVGYGGLAAIIFAETGLLVGFFLPGDSLLFTAGLACVPGNQLLGEHHMSIWLLNLILIPAAIIGDTVGYWIGYKAGEAMYKREKTFFFRKDHLLYTKAFYEKHGGKTIVLARFVPLIRTFAPVVAGIAQMPYRRFVAYNVFGGMGWIVSLSLLGYFLGQQERVKNNLEATIVLIIVISLLPAIITFVKTKFFSPALGTDGEHTV
ncbi:MAG: VTT domain-containing protein [Planctomycetota bacterium]|nr:VTT domain-containing protein [Planctomycetota bacterium]